jgi:transposase
MSRFADRHHLASWAGLYPGNNEWRRAKRRTGKPRKGSWWLRGALVQAGWAAVRTKRSDGRAPFAGSRRAAGGAMRGDCRGPFAS